MTGVYHGNLSSYISNFLSGPDGSRHSSDQHPKDVNSENSNYCPIFVREFLSSRRQTPEVWNFCVFTVFEFLSHLPGNSRASRGRKFQFFVFFVFCGLKLLRACLKASALTGYVGDAQLISEIQHFYFSHRPTPAGLLERVSFESVFGRVLVGFRLF